MKRSDLFREYARVVDMCEPQKINPAKCVKQNSFADFEITPEFCDLIESYTFAIGICEGKPVFAGDVLYSKGNGDARPVTTEYTWNYANSTWTKPDPYSELKKAQADGEVIQFLCGSVWVDLIEEDMTVYKVDFLRVKPDPVVETRTIGVNIKSAGNGNLIECTWIDGVLTNVEIVK